MFYLYPIEYAEKRKFWWNACIRVLFNIFNDFHFSLSLALSRYIFSLIYLSRYMQESSPTYVQSVEKALRVRTISPSTWESTQVNDLMRAVCVVRLSRRPPSFKNTWGRTPERRALFVVYVGKHLAGIIVWADTWRYILEGGGFLVVFAGKGKPKCFVIIMNEYTEIPPIQKSNNLKNHYHLPNLVHITKKETDSETFEWETL